MSSSVAEVYDAIEDAKLHKMRTNWDAYRDVLIDLAQGTDVDPAEVAIVLDMVEVDRQRLSDDVEKMKKRLEARATVDRQPEILSAIQAAEQKHQQLVSEYNAAVARLDPQIKSAYAALGAAQADLSTVGFAESTLISTCFDPVIAHRQQRLEKRRKVLSSEIDRINLALADHGQRRVSNAERMAKSEKQRAIAFTHGRSQNVKKYEEARKSAESYEAALPGLRKFCDELQKQLDALRRELAQVLHELADLQRAKLQP